MKEVFGAHFVTVQKHDQQHRNGDERSDIGLSRRVPQIGDDEQR
jgi:hypothetical protein